MDILEIIFEDLSPYVPKIFKCAVGTKIAKGLRIFLLRSLLCLFAGLLPPTSQILLAPPLPTSAAACGGPAHNFRAFQTSWYAFINPN
jgi:hypothetical protein